MPRRIPEARGAAMKLVLLVLFVLACLFVVACAEDSPHGPTPAPDVQCAAPRPTPAARSHDQSIIELTKTPASLDHRILLSDVVVRASFLSATATSRRCPAMRRPHQPAKPRWNYGLQSPNI